MLQLSLVVIRLINHLKHTGLQLVDLLNLLYGLQFVFQDRLSNDVCVSIEDLKLELLDVESVLFRHLLKVPLPHCHAIKIRERFVQKFGSLLKHESIIADNCFGTHFQRKGDLPILLSSLGWIVLWVTYSVPNGILVTN